MHALQCLRDPRRPTGRTQPGRDPPRTTRAHQHSRPLLTRPSTASVLFTAHSRIGPDEAARTPACSARMRSMLPHAPRNPPIHAHTLAPSPRRSCCQTVPVKVQTSVSWQAAEARIGLSSRHRGGGTPSEPLSGYSYAPHMSTPMGRSKEGRQRPTDRPMAASQQHDPEQQQQPTAL